MMNTSRIQEQLERTNRASVTGLDGAAAAFLISELHRAGGRRILVLCPTITSAGRFFRDLRYFLGKPGGVHAIPAYETLPFEREPPDMELAARRVAALRHLASAEGSIWVASSAILSRLLAPPDILKGACLSFSPGAVVDPLAVARHLDLLGYQRVPLVDNHGEYGVRGGILDIFSPGWEGPLRLDIMDNRIESMKWFNPENQRSLAAADGALLLPSTEIVTDDAAGIFRRRARALSPLFGREDSPLTGVHQEISEFGVRPWHVSLLPLFYETPADIFDYCPRGTVVALVNESEVLQRARAHLDELRIRGQEEGYDGDFIERFAKECGAALAALEMDKRRGPAVLRLSPLPLHEEKAGTWHIPAAPVSLRLAGNSRPRRGGGWPAAEQIRSWQQESKVVLVSRTGGSARRLQNILKEYDIGTLLVEDRPFDPSWTQDADRSPIVHVGDLQDGFRLPDAGLTVVAEDDLFGPKRRREDRRPRAALFDLDFSALKTGDFLVHEEHGIATFGGLTRIRVNSHEEEMLSLHYAGGGRLFVPMDRLYLVQRYIYAEGPAPAVDRLGGKAWPQAKAKARRAVRTMVREMLRTQARRHLAGGHAFGPDTPWQKEFEAGFEYEETPDQWRSIEEVKRDMEGDKPMDRLVCGDVGYGKTEVAMRAAFKAVSNGKQVAVMAPTTVLCEQHNLTFSRRFAPFPMQVAVLSRFTPPTPRAAVITGLAQGTVDVVIGTHRLLQEDVRFRDLGLLVIDEEHRFGVKHKEKLKRFKEMVDVLTLSATPIPRTFYMAMSGLRDLSIIETPPENRLGVKTKVLAYSEKVIRESILREMARGGQVFFLHNRVQSIHAMTHTLGLIVPEARICMAHGQMSETALKKVMSEFIAGDHDVLVSTSIVESGLDIPNANTMIINRADRYGLADLYQLRGRIGRSDHQAYAYLMIPPENLTETARQRLAAIEEFSHLGAGASIAALDLEIRGAGNLLGYEQSGRMAEVGLEMYTRILEETVAEMKGEPSLERAISHPEINAPYAAFIPEGYMPDVNQRLAAYKRLSLLEREEDLARLSEELSDIFGQPPREARMLFDVCALRLAARKAGVEKVVITQRSAEAVFSRSTPVDPARVLDLIRRSQGSVRLKDQERLIFSLPGDDPLGDLSRLKMQLLGLAGYGTFDPVLPDSPAETSLG